MYFNFQVAGYEMDIWSDIVALKHVERPALTGPGRLEKQLRKKKIEGVLLLVHLPYRFGTLHEMIFIAMWCFTILNF